jgi:hypothetical protein
VSSSAAAHVPGRAFASLRIHSAARVRSCAPAQLVQIGGAR